MATFRRPTVLILAGVALSVALLFGLWIPYGDAAVWPGFAGNLAGSLVAFTAALYWDRTQRRQQRLDDEADRARAVGDERSREYAELETEARRRLAAVVHELESNQKGLDRVAQTSAGLSEPLFVLSSGMWRASAEALGRILGDIELVAAIADFYERLSELQWRLRRIVEIWEMVSCDSDHMSNLVNPSDLLARELSRQLPGLLERVNAAAENPVLLSVFAPFIPSKTTVFGGAAFGAGGFGG